MPVYHLTESYSIEKIIYGVIDKLFSLHWVSIANLNAIYMQTVN